MKPAMSVLAAAALATGLPWGVAQAAAPKVDTSQPTPVVYPEVAQRNGEEGTVVLDVQVRPSGRAETAQVVGSSGYRDLDNAAVETVLGWRFVPGDSDTARVSVVYKLPQNAQK